MNASLQLGFPWTAWGGGGGGGGEWCTWGGGGDGRKGKVGERWKVRGREGSLVKGPLAAS